MDSCSAHGTTDTTQKLKHVELAFLPPNTISNPQALHAGIIAAIKARYRRREMEHFNDLLDVWDMYIYKSDILTAIKLLTNIRNDVSETTIRS